MLTIKYLWKFYRDELENFSKTQAKECTEIKAQCLSLSHPQCGEAWVRERKKWGEGGGVEVGVKEGETVSVSVCAIYTCICVSLGFGFSSGDLLRALPLPLPLPLSTPAELPCCLLLFASFFLFSLLLCSHTQTHRAEKKRMYVCSTTLKVN